MCVLLASKKKYKKIPHNRRPKKNEPQKKREKKRMRAGETVVVCGARADKAQFVPFEWPQHAVVWVSVGCGNLTLLAPAPSDADSEARDELARKYVEAVGADRREEVEADRREEAGADRRAVGADRREEEGADRREEAGGDVV